jgi:hypothetical protein
MAELETQFVISKLGGQRLSLTPRSATSETKPVEPVSPPESEPPLRGIFGDRKVLFIRMVMDRLLETQETLNDSSASSLHTMVFYPEEVCLNLNLVQDGFWESRQAARRLNISDLLWCLNEVAAQNRRVLSGLFNNLFASSLVSGYKTYRLELLSGELICTSEDSLLITEQMEKLLSELNCRTTYDVYRLGLENTYYPELSKRLRNLFGILFFEECFVVTSSLFLLERFLVKNFSKASQAEVLRTLSNERNVRSLEKRIDREIADLLDTATCHEMGGDISKAEEARKLASRRSTAFSLTLEKFVKQPTLAVSASNVIH